MSGVYLIIWTQPPLFRQPKRISAAISLLRSRWGVPEPYHASDSRLIEERVFLDAIHLFELAVSLFEAEKVLVMRRSVYVSPNGNRILFGRRRG